MFASLIMLAGGGMGVSFAFMWVVSIKEMWFIEKEWFCKAESTCKQRLKLVFKFILKVIKFTQVTLLPKSLELLKSLFSWLYNKMK